MNRQPPGLFRRLAAISYDALIVGALLIAVTAMTLLFSKGSAISAGTIWYQLLLGTIVTAYFSVSWWRRGQTIGMMAWRLRVVTPAGTPVSLRSCIIRAVAAVVSWLPAGLGFLWVLVDRHGRSWHDLLSGTVLVYEKPFSAPAPGQ